MCPSDYDDLGVFFDAICSDYHDNPGGEAEDPLSNWSLKDVAGCPRTASWTSASSGSRRRSPCASASGATSRRSRCLGP